MFRVTKQARALLADMHDRGYETTVSLIRENLLNDGLPDEVKKDIDRVGWPESFKDWSVFRVVLDERWPTLKVDERENIRSNDMKFRHGDRIVLVINETLSEELEDLTMEVVDTNKGPKFRFRDHASLI